MCGGVRKWNFTYFIKIFVCIFSFAKLNSAYLQWKTLPVNKKNDTKIVKNKYRKPGKFCAAKSWSRKFQQVTRLYSLLLPASFPPPKFGRFFRCSLFLSMIWLFLWHINEFNVRQDLGKTKPSISLIQFLRILSATLSYFISCVLTLCMK